MDPGGDAGRVDTFCAIFEDVAPGDRIPLHRHSVYELVFVLDGMADVTIGDTTQRAEPGATVFVPAGVTHGHRNAGAGILRIRAVFPGTEIDIEMLERNAAPGTEDRSPAHTVYDARTGAFRVVAGPD